MNDIWNALFLTIDIMTPIIFVFIAIDGYRKRRGMWWLIDKLDNKATPTTVNYFYVKSQNVQINTDDKTIKLK